MREKEAALLGLRTCSSRFAATTCSQSRRLSASPRAPTLPLGEERRQPAATSFQFNWA